MADFETSLTALAHGGGCGCKLSPAVLRDLLAGLPAARAFPDLLVGTETGDDAAVYRLNDTQALVATTDFFTPIVDDPFDFGRIAATNALSDVYAMGGRPILALAILGMPLGKIDPAAVKRILAGGAVGLRRGRHSRRRRPLDRQSRNRSTAWRRSAWCGRTASCATAPRRPATRSS